MIIKKLRKDISQISLIAILAVVSVFIFWLSYLSPWIAEDYIYRFNFAKGGEIVFEQDASTLGIPIQSIGDIVDSQCRHYQLFNGRFLAHFIVQFNDSFLNPVFFGIINSLMWILMILLLARLCSIKFSNIPGILSSIFILIIGINTFFFPAAQIGYVWMCVLSLLFLNIYFSQSKSLTIFHLIFIALLCVIIGNSHETYNIGISGALIIYNLRHFRTINSKQWVMFFSFGLGALALCFAPSNLSKTSSLHLPLFYTIEKFLIYPRVTYLPIATLIYYRIKRSLNLKEFFKDNEFFVYSFFISVVFNLLLGVYGNRQLFGMELWAMVLTLRLLHKHCFSKPILFLLCIYILFDFSYKLYFIDIQNKLINEIEYKWENSEDGKIFMDVLPLPYYDYLAPCPYMTYGEPAIGTIGQKLRYENNSTKPLILYPEKMDSLINVPHTNYVYEYEPGCYFLLQDKTNPATFVLQREFNVLGLKYPKADYVVDFDLNSPFNTENYNIMQIEDKIPFVKNKGVKIVM